MLFLYNLLQLLVLPLLAPILALVALSRAKYRHRTPSRLGWGLRHLLRKPEEKRLTFWVHALSVGETTSAVPLLEGIRAAWPESRIIFSVTTRSGRRVANRVMHDLADTVINSPFDILPVVLRFYNRIEPDCYILVETDFWPNILHIMHRRGVPTLLVNGRVSDEALAGYRKLRFFFTPMFASFTALCLQTAADSEKLKSLGLPAERLHTLGNLKFDTMQQGDKNSAVLEEIRRLLPAGRTIFIAGSTHPGEEEILLTSFALLKKEFPKLFLILAPRHVARAVELQKICARAGFPAVLRTDEEKAKDVLILNTIGELAACYMLGEISFVGGSLVKRGGHNPIEPALAGHPVFFGPSMEDFSEISEDLLQAGAATTVRNADELTNTMRPLLIDKQKRHKTGENARQCVLRQQGVIKRHLDLIRSLLKTKR